MAMAMQNAQVIVSWQKKLPRRAYLSLLLSMNSMEVVNGQSVLAIYDLSTSFSFMSLDFLSILIPASAHTRSTPYNVARRYYLFFSFCALPSNKSFPPLFSFLSRPRVPLSIHLFSLSLVLALGRSRIPLPHSFLLSFIIITGALYVLLSNNMTQQCCYLFLFSSYRSRALPYISYPSLSLRRCLLPKQT